jgi:hypothetical protein
MPQIKYKVPREIRTISVQLFPGVDTEKSPHEARALVR